MPKRYAHVGLLAVDVASGRSYKLSGFPDIRTVKREPDLM